MMGHAASQAHMNGDCWPSQCQACIAEDRPSIVGECLACGAVEVELVNATGYREYPVLTWLTKVPTGHGCETCAR